MPDDQSVFVRLEAAGQKPRRVMLRGAPSGDATDQCGRYEVLGRLAQGGVGEVWRGRDVDIGRDVALKVLRAGHADSPEMMQRFVDEAQISGQLQHPGIVPVYELGMRADRRPYIAMKLVKGKTLAAMLRDGGISRRRLLQVFEQICRTIAYAHERGVVHRDLKPANVMVGAFGEVQVLDWGFAKVLARGGVADERRPAPEVDVTLIATQRSSDGTESEVGSVMGTPAYMPPEQALGQVDELDERSDVFSLGAILCEILTGKPPYDGERTDVFMQAAQAQLEDAYRRLDGCEADREIVALARRCLSPLRADRPADGAEVGDAILAYIADVEERVHRAEVAAAKAAEETKRVRLEVVGQRRARKQSLVLGVAVVFAIAIAGVSYATFSGRTRARQRQAADAVASALTRAQRHRGMGQWVESRAAAEQAVALSRDADEATRSRAAAVLSATHAEERAALQRQQQRDGEQRLLLAIDEIRLERGDDYGTEAGTDAALVALFAKHGVDVESPQSAAAEVGSNWAGISINLAATLDEWAWMRRDLDTDPASLIALARIIDPDPWRNRLRDALDDTDASALLSLSAEAAGRDDLSVRTLDLLAVALRTVGEKKAAVATARRAWGASPGDFWINIHLGRWLRTAAPAEALRFCEAAIALRPSSAFAWHSLAHACGNAGDRERSHQAFRAAIRLAPGTAHHWSCFTVALADVGDQIQIAAVADEAVTIARQAARLTPGDSVVHYNLGNVLRAVGRVDEAIAAYGEAIRLDPTHAMSHNNLGHALKMKGDIDGAIAAFREVIRLDPDDNAGHINLGATLISIGDVIGAITAANEAIRIDPKDSAGHVNLGLARLQGGNADGAIAAHRRALALNPGDWYAHGGLGAALVHKGDLEGAIAAHRESIRLRPDRSRAHSLLGLALMAKGAVDEAIASYRMAIRLDTSDATPHVNLCQALMTKGDLDGCIAAARAALRLDPGMADAHVNMGVAFYRKCDADAAVAAHRAAIRLEPNHRNAHYNLGNALWRKGDADGAALEFREALRINPDYGEVHCNLGHLLRQQGKFKQALASLRKGHALGSRLPGWHYPSPQWVQHAQYLVDLEGRLPGLVAGEAKPRDLQERVMVAGMLYIKKRFSDSARFYNTVLDQVAGTQDLRYNAACAAVLVKTPEWRDRALEWLRKNLDQLARSPAKAKPILQHWKDDPDFTSVRDRLGGLPEAEHASWKQLWADVDAVLVRAVAK